MKIAIILVIVAILGTIVIALTVNSYALWWLWLALVGFIASLILLYRDPK